MTVLLTCLGHCQLCVSPLLTDPEVFLPRHAFCISYFPITAAKHHDQGDLESGLFGVYSPRGIRGHHYHRGEACPQAGIAMGTES